MQLKDIISNPELSEKALQKCSDFFKKLTFTSNNSEILEQQKLQQKLIKGTGKLRCLAAQLRGIDKHFSLRFYVNNMIFRPSLSDQRDVFERDLLAQLSDEEFFALCSSGPLREIPTFEDALLNHVANLTLTEKVGGITNQAFAEFNLDSARSDLKMLENSMRERVRCIVEIKD